MTFDSDQIILLSGSSHPAITNEIASNLDITPGRVDLNTFPDGEVSLQVLDSVRGRDVFMVQSIALNPNQYLMELLILIDACKRASARSIIPIIPYFGYCRQDRKDKPRVPITAKLVANLLETAGATRILTMDLHAKQVQGFFDIPVDNLEARPALATATRSLRLDDFVVVTPDVGSIKLARSYATHLNRDLAIVDKRRVNARQIETTTLIGEVKDRNVLLVDDMCSTAGTLINAANICKEKGAKRICAAITHPVFVEECIKPLNDSPIEMILAGNTIQTDDRPMPTRIRITSVAPTFAEAIRCIQTGTSLSSLFELARTSH